MVIDKMICLPPKIFTSIRVKLVIATYNRNYMLGKTILEHSQNLRNCCSIKTWSISPAIVVRGTAFEKPQSVSPTGLFVRSTVRENQNQFSQRENCSLSLALTLFDFREIEKPCPFELRGIFRNSTPYSF
jgi:hypothetical protein